MEVETEAVADAVFEPMFRDIGYAEKLSFTDNSVNLAWVTRGSAMSDRNNANHVLESIWP